jgi:hypothetical protein
MSKTKSIYAEQSLLGGLLIQNSHWHDVSQVVTESDFFKREHRIIFNAITKLANNQVPFDLVTLSDTLKNSRELDNIGGLPYLAKLYEDTPTAENTLSYAKMVKDYANHRAMLETLKLSLSLAENGQLSADDLIESLQAFKSTAKPATHNHVLDTSTHYCNVDFLNFVDDRHLLKQYALTISKATFLPVHTVFLVGLGVFSSIACRRWCVEYPDGDTLPLGLYLVAEQPSGTAKSRTIRAFQRPFYEAEHAVKTRVKEKLQQLLADKENKDNNAAEIERLHKVLRSVLFATNATPEALELSLFNTQGYFSAVSAEQGLFNTILGGCYSDKASNNDLLLNGFVAEYMGSMRVSREGFTGIVTGGVTMFAQTGGIETLLKASNGTGLAERFLMIAEQHNLGRRDFKTKRFINRDIAQQYNDLCRHFADYVIEESLKYADLSRLDICREGWNAIEDFKHHTDYHLADGGRYSHIAIRGAAAKMDIQVMKIAANLHLLDDYQRKTTTIELKHVHTAIEIVNVMIEARLNLCRDKSIIGQKAEYQAILSLFETSTKPRTEREIINAKSQTNPFKDYTGNKSELVRSVLNDMVSNGVLQIVQIKNDKINGKPIKAYALAQ